MVPPNDLLRRMERAMADIYPGKLSGGPIDGMRIVANPYLTKTVEDWSGCRSRARAERRRRQGHPQRVKRVDVPDQAIYYVDGCAYAHPVVVAQIRNQVTPK